MSESPDAHPGISVEIAQILDQIPAMLILKEAASLRFAFVNKSAEKTLGMSRAQLLGKTDHDFFPKEQADGFVAADRRALQSDQAILIANEVVNATEGQRHLRTRKAAIRDNDNAPRYLLVMCEDITSERQVDERLRQASKVFESTRDGIMITDAQQRILATNPAFTLITGYSEAEVVGHKPALFRFKQHGKAFHSRLWKQIRQTGGWQGEVWNTRKNGELFAEWVTISSVLDAQQQITNYIAVFSDITQIKETERKLEHLAHHDALTELPNRLVLQQRLEQEIATVDRDGKYLAVLFLDLDHFKNVNDSYGHPVGDAVLREAAKRLTASVRTRDTVSRISGDEFVLLITGVTQPLDAARLSEKLIANFNRPMVINGRELHVGISVGISLYPTDGATPEQMLRNADTALYQAKAAGRNTYSFYLNEMTTIVQLRMTVETELRHALALNQLELHYQPQFSMDNKTLLGFEALVRWNRPGHGLVLPEHFIPIAETSGLIESIGQWVLREACKQGRIWLDAGHEIGRIGINLSGKQFDRENLVDTVKGILAETRFPPQHLIFEVTESAIMGNPERANAHLEALRKLGIQISVDDFGTGYSSLAYLKRLPLDKLKIDKSFILDIPLDLNDQAITRAVISMSQALNLTVLAEGVETDAQRNFLLQEGCQEVQGYLFGRPIAANLCTEWLQLRRNEVLKIEPWPDQNPP